jgi:hypothetical protein
MHAEQLLPPPTANPTSMVKDDALVSFLGFGLEAEETVPFSCTSAQNS